MRLGVVRGIEVRIHWSLLGIAALLTAALGADLLPAADPGAPGVVRWLVAGVVAVAFLGSVLAHELAHATVARRRGIPVPSITLWLLGGVALLGAEPSRPGDELRVAVAGPATSAAVAVATGAVAWALGATGAPDVVVAGVGWLAVTNGVLAVFNLLPGAPLDGGRILRALAWRRLGDRDRATLVASAAGRFLGTLLMVAGLANVLFGVGFGSLWTALVGWFIVGAAEAEALAARASIARRRALDAERRARIWRVPGPDPGWWRVPAARWTAPEPSWWSPTPLGDPDGVVRVRPLRWDTPVAVDPRTGRLIVADGTHHRRPHHRREQP